jgi:long-chain fatty acid transport protein
MMRRSSLFVPIAAAIALVAPPLTGMASASPVADIIGSVGGNAGAQGVASGPGVASTYFNPALLDDAEDSALFAFALATEQIGVTLDGRRGGDVPLVVGGRDIVTPGLVPIPNDTVPTPWLQTGCAAGTQAGTCPPPGFKARPRQAQGTSGKTRSYLTLGLVKNVVRDRFTVGLYALLPIGHFTTASGFYADEREALFSNSLHPELYGDRMTAISIVAGASFRLIPELSIGAGLSIGMASAASSATYVRDSTNYDSLLLNNAITTNVSVSPTVGVRFKPIPRLRIGGTLHTPESFTIDTTVGASLPSGTDSGTTRHDVFDWMPWSAVFGAEGDVIARGKYTMSVTASMTYAFWSAYEDRHGVKPSDYGNDLAWKDTLSGAIGVRHVYGSARGFIDLTYVPSPVPEQIGRSNYVDNDRVGMALGADVELKLGSMRLRPGIQLFGNRLLRRHTTKDDSRIVDEVPDGSIFGSTHDPVPSSQGLQTNNPGWPGFASAGWVYGGALSVQVPL